MANIKSKEKNIKRIEKATIRNKAKKSAIKTAIKKAKLAAIENDKDLDQKVSIARKTLFKAVAHGVIHKNNAARRMSRLDAFIKRTVANN